MKRLCKDFDLTTQHLTGGDYYVPPKARSSTEIERRHELPRGTIITEQQHRGVLVASFVLSHIEDPQDLFFAANIFAPAAYNASWHSIAENAAQMRFRLKLPRFDLMSNTVLEHTRTAFSQVGVHAKSYVNAQTEQSPHLDEARERLGRNLGEAALLLGCLPLQDSLDGVSAATAQVMARDAAMQTAYAARRLGDETGKPPTIAQSSDPDSDLAVYIRRHAPNGVYDAFDGALNQFAMPR